jgi:uncharacterized protein YqjF (DUF2071 family)
MNRVSKDNPASVAAMPAAERQRLAVKDEPLLMVQWHRVLFLHFAVEPSIVQAHLPGPLDLELYQGQAIVSLVALTKRHFRPLAGAPLWTRCLSLLTEQRLFNVRSYVRHHGKPGAFFFWSWLSRPWSLPWPDQPLGLTCAFADSRYEHRHEAGDLRGVVAKGTASRFVYEAHMDPHAVFAPCPPASLAEFALEHTTGYFWHGGAGRVFHAEHPPWSQIAVNVRIKDHSLVTGKFPWLREARFLAAHYTPGFDEVRIGRPILLDPRARVSRPHQHHHGASAFFEMP